MSIASEFDSTIENIKSDYEGLENLGADLTNVNKNIQNIRTCLDNIYSSLPKTTGEGSNLSLNTLKGRINVEAVKGDTEQDKTLGYNIAPVNTSSYTLGENDISITGGGNGATLFDNISLTANTTYYLKLVVLQKPTTSTSFTTYIDGTPNDNIGFINFQNDIIGVVLTKTYTPTSNAILKVRQWGNSNNEFIKFQYWITTDNTKNTFEPYTNGASPNPTYPQDINVVTGTQEVVVQNKNLAHIEAEGKYRSSASGNFSTNANYNGYIAKVSQNTTYTSSFINMASNYNDVSNLCYFDKNMNFISGNSYNTANKTFTTPSNCAYATMAVKTTITDFQVELGSTASSYVEHQEQTKTLHLGDIELAKIGNYQDRIFESSGKNIFNPDVTGLYTSGCNVSESNGEITITATQNGDIYVGNVRASGGTYVVDRGVKIPVAPLTSYVLSLTNSNVNKLFITEYDSNNISLGYIQNSTITTQANTSYITIRYGLENATNGTSYKTRIMVNKGSSALPYEPYGSDKWYIEKNIGKYAINGASGTFSKPSTNRFNIDGALTDYLKNNNAITCMSDKYVSYEQKPTNSDFSTLVANVNYGIELSSSTTAFTIRIKDTNYDDIDQYKTWLASNNVELLYVLTAPTYTEITNTTLIEELNELEKMMSYNGQTNISVSGNLPMILDVSALKGE